MQGELKPVAWMYSREDGSKDLVLDCNGEYARRLLELGATETPLYAHPPTTNPVVVSETPVGDHQMVEAVDREAADEICNPKDDKHLHAILCKKFARHRQAALTAARAQVEGENQRLREALGHYAKDYDYEDKRSQWDGGAIARQALRAKGPGQ